MCYESFRGKTHVHHNLQSNEEVGAVEHHLDFRYNGSPFRAGPSKCCERSRGNHGTGPGKAADVTTRDVILLMPHNDGIHDKEAPPWQPECVLLGNERRTLEVEGYGHAPIGHQVKTGTKKCTMPHRLSVIMGYEKYEKCIFPIKQKWEWQLAMHVISCVLGIKLCHSLLWIYFLIRWGCKSNKWML